MVKRQTMMSLAANDLHTPEPISSAFVQRPLVVHTACLHIDRSKMTFKCRLSAQQPLRGCRIGANVYVRFVVFIYTRFCT